jgi:hypothetical protein
LDFFFSFVQFSSSFLFLLVLLRQLGRGLVTTLLLGELGQVGTGQEIIVITGGLLGASLELGALLGSTLQQKKGSYEQRCSYSTTQL